MSRDGARGFLSAEALKARRPAERLKAAFAKAQESQNGPEIYDFRPVFYWELVGVGCRLMVLVPC
jgi:hypothetical protein